MQCPDRNQVISHWILLAVAVYLRLTVIYPERAYVTDRKITLTHRSSETAGDWQHVSGGTSRGMGDRMKQFLTKADFQAISSLKWVHLFFYGVKSSHFPSTDNTHWPVPRDCYSRLSSCENQKSTELDSYEKNRRKSKEDYVQQITTLISRTTSCFVFFS